MYYLRTKAASAAIKFTVDKSKLKASKGVGEKDKEGGDVEKVAENMATLSCSINNRDDCLACGS
jgi:ribonucleoside-diphosphate reductase subunit M1